MFNVFKEKIVYGSFYGYLDPDGIGSEPLITVIEMVAMFSISSFP